LNDRRGVDSLEQTDSLYSSYSTSNPIDHFKNLWNVLDIDSGYHKICLRVSLAQRRRREDSRPKMRREVE
jgi:hypothetical protein